MDGVSSLLECSLEEGHHVGLVLSELNKLGLKLIVPLLKPPETNFNVNFVTKE